MNKVAEDRVAKWPKKRDVTETKVLDYNSVDYLSCGYLLDYFRDSHFDKLITLNEPTYHDIVFQFYANLGVDRSNVNCTMVNGIIVLLDKFIINEVLGCPFMMRTSLRIMDGVLSTVNWRKGRQGRRTRGPRFPKVRTNDQLYSLYNDMKGAMREMITLNRDTYMLQKTFRSIKRTEFSSNFTFLAHQDQPSGSRQTDDPDNQEGGNGNEDI